MIVFMFLFVLYITLLSLQITCQDSIYLELMMDNDRSASMLPLKSLLQYQSILRLQLDQSGLAKVALVQTYDTIHYQLWHVLPFALAPPRKAIFVHHAPFLFATDIHCKWLILAFLETDMLCFKVWERTQMRKGTMGSWHERKLFRVASRGMSQSQFNTSTLSMHYFLSSMLLYEFQEHFHIRQLLLPHINICDFDDPLVFAMHHDHLLLGNPFFNQSDGQVECFALEQDGELISKQIIAAPVKCGYFGSQIKVLANRLIISAPFLGNGLGCVYMFHMSLDSSQPPIGPLTQVIVTPRLSHNTLIRAVYHFGETLNLSRNGDMLVIGSFHGGNSELFLYRFDGKRYYEWNVMLTVPTIFHQLHVSLDDSGNCLFSDQNAVYFVNATSLSNRTEVTNIKPVVGMPIAVVSPHYLRIKRKELLYQRQRRKKIPLRPQILYPSTQQTSSSHHVGFNLDAVMEFVNLLSGQSPTKAYNNRFITFNKTT